MVPRARGSGSASSSLARRAARHAARRGLVRVGRARRATVARIAPDFWIAIHRGPAWLLLECRRLGRAAGRSLSRGIPPVLRGIAEPAAHGSPSLADVAVARVGMLSAAWAAVGCDREGRR